MDPRLVTFSVGHEDLKPDTSFTCNNDISEGVFPALKRVRTYLHNATLTKILNFW